MANTNLQKAKTAKNDEFYTQLTDVAKELMHYKKHFRDKIVFCNCDDPTWSAFWKYFHLNFAELGLKKLISTHYDREEATYKMEYTGGDDNDIEVGVKTPLEGNGDFRNQECLDLLDECDIVCTNEPFSLFREYIAVLMDHKKKFLIIGNKNAITYKEFFPLLKNNEVWIGCNNVKEFLQPDGSIKKFGNIGWFTNLDVAKRHEKLILWKHYTPEEYPQYDNYMAINVDKVAEIPCDYCESWGVTDEEYKNLEEHQWEITRTTDGLYYIIPAAGTRLREELSRHTEGYKEHIEAELTSQIYCSGQMGVPITFLDKYNPEQFDIVMESLESQSHSSTNTARNSSELSVSIDMSKIIQDTDTDLHSMTRRFTQEYLSGRYCNGIMGVPITFLDKHSPDQFEIIGLLQSSTDEQAGVPNLKYYNEFKEMRQDMSFTGSSGGKANGNPVIKGKPQKGNFLYNPITEEYVHSVYARVVILKK